MNAGGTYAAEATNASYLLAGVPIIMTATNAMVNPTSNPQALVEIAFKLRENVD